jgi:hypothetical protein
MKKIFYSLIFVCATFTTSVAQAQIINSYANVAAVAGFDTDAQLAINAIGTLTEPQKTALNNLVVGFKNAGTWSKFKAIYPLIGGTAASHKWNIKDPRDLDAAYRLTFVNGGGSFTHSSNGISNTGSSYARTYAIGSSVLSQNSGHLSIYSKTNGDFGGAAEMGGIKLDESNGAMILIKWGISYSAMNDNKVSGGFSPPFVNELGLYVTNRIDANTLKISRNGTTVNIAATSLPPINFELYLCGANRENNSVFSSRRLLAFGSFGEGFTDAEIVANNTVIQAYQEALGRKEL